MTAPLDEHKFERLKFFLKDDASALSLAVDLIYLAHLLDDLVDRDVERSVEDVKRGFRVLLVDNPNNPFLQAHFLQLTPLMGSALMTYLDSTTLEHGDKDERFKAFHIRNDVLKIIRHMMLLTGGADWSQEQGPEFWREFGPPEAKYEEYLKEKPTEVSDEKAA